MCQNLTAVFQMKWNVYATHYNATSNSWNRKYIFNQQFTFSCSVPPYTHMHTLHWKVPARQVSCTGSPSKGVTDCKHCERVKSKVSFPIAFSSCDPYNITVHLELTCQNYTLTGILLLGYETWASKLSGLGVTSSRFSAKPWR